MKSRGNYPTILTEPEGIIVLVHSHEVISTASERKPLKNDLFD